MKSLPKGLGRAKERYERIKPRFDSVTKPSEKGMPLHYGTYSTGDVMAYLSRFGDCVRAWHEEEPSNYSEPTWSVAKGEYFLAYVYYGCSPSRNQRWYAELGGKNSTLDFEAQDETLEGVMQKTVEGWKALIEESDPS